jgi:hypothetical protein
MYYQPVGTGQGFFAATEMPQSCPPVAQISNLRYRRIPLGEPTERLETLALAKACRLEIRDTAGWNPALRAFSPGKTEALPPWRYSFSSAPGLSPVGTSDGFVSRFNGFATICSSR